MTGNEWKSLDITFLAELMKILEGSTISSRYNEHRKK
jgi:hypothetical protein